MSDNVSDLIRDQISTISTTEQNSQGDAKVNYPPPEKKGSSALIEMLRSMLDSINLPDDVTYIHDYSSDFWFRVHKMGTNNCLIQNITVSTMPTNFPLPSFIPRVIPVIRALIITRLLTPLPILAFTECNTEKPIERFWNKSALESHSEVTRDSNFSVVADLRRAISVGFKGEDLYTTFIFSPALLNSCGSTLRLGLGWLLDSLSYGSPYQSDISWMAGKGWLRSAAIGNPPTGKEMLTNTIRSNYLFPLHSVLHDTLSNVAGHNTTLYCCSFAWWTQHNHVNNIKLQTAPNGPVVNLPITYVFVSQAVSATAQFYQMLSSLAHPVTDIQILEGDGDIEFHSTDNARTRWSTYPTGPDTPPSLWLLPFTELVSWKNIDVNFLFDGTATNYAAICMVYCDIHTQHCSAGGDIKDDVTGSSLNDFDFEQYTPTITDNSLNVIIPVNTFVNPINIWNFITENGFNSFAVASCVIELFNWYQGRIGTKEEVTAIWRLAADFSTRVHQSESYCDQLGPGVQSEGNWQFGTVLDNDDPYIVDENYYHILSSDDVGGDDGTSGRETISTCYTSPSYFRATTLVNQTDVLPGLKGFSGKLVSYDPLLFVCVNNGWYIPNNTIRVAQEKWFGMISMMRDNMAAVSDLVMQAYYGLPYDVLAANEYPEFYINMCPTLDKIINADGPKFVQHCPIDYATGVRGQMFPQPVVAGTFWPMCRVASWKTKHIRDMMADWHQEHENKGIEMEVTPYYGTNQLRVTTPLYKYYPLKMNKDALDLDLWLNFSALCYGVHVEGSYDATFLKMRPNEPSGLATESGLNNLLTTSATDINNFALQQFKSITPWFPFFTNWRLTTGNQIVRKAIIEQNSVNDKFFRSTNFYIPVFKTQLNYTQYSGYAQDGVVMNPSAEDPL